MTLDFRQLTGDLPGSSLPQQIVAGYVSNEQPPPAGTGDPMYVVIPAHSTEVSTPVKWSQGHGTALPQAGADVLVAKDPSGPWRCVWWDGSYQHDTTPLAVMPPPSGDTTGATDGAALSAAISGLGGPGTIQFRQGTYWDNVNHGLDNTVNLSFVGMGGLSGGAAPGTRLVYTGSASSYMSLRSSSGFVCRDMMVEYSNSSFTGDLFDFSHSSSAIDASHFVFERASITGAGIRTARLFNLDKAIIGVFNAVAFGNGTYAVAGAANGSSYSNVITFGAGCSFNGFVNPPILNPVQDWTFAGVTFEPLFNGSAGAIASSLGSCSGLTWDGCWTGDSNGSGDWIDLALSGSSIAGGYIGSGNTGVNLHASSNGVTVKGVTFVGLTNGIGVGTNCTNLDLHPNFYNAVTNHVSYAALPEGSIFTDSTDRLNTSQLWARGGLATMTANTTGLTSAQIDALFTVTPVDGMLLVDTTNNVQLQRAGGKWYKTAVLTLIP